MDQEFRGVRHSWPVLQVINRAWVLITVAVPEWIKDLFVWYDRKNKDPNPA